MKTIDIYLAHRDSIKFIEQQVLLINKYFKCNTGSKINIYGYVDGANEYVKEQMREKWRKNNVNLIEIPKIINYINRDYSNSSESFGLAFTYVYQKYIK